MSSNDRSGFDAERARAARTAQSFSQQEVAEAIGVSTSTVKMWETGARRPSSVAVTERLAGLLGVPLEQLLPGAEHLEGASLAALRRMLRITRAEMAAQLGTTVRIVERVEHGERLPDAPAAWARAYGLTMGELSDAWARGWQESQKS